MFPLNVFWKSSRQIVFEKFLPNKNQEITPAKGFFENGGCQLPTRRFLNRFLFSERVLEALPNPLPDETP